MKRRARLLSKIILLCVFTGEAFGQTLVYKDSNGVLSETAIKPEAEGYSVVEIDNTRTRMEYDVDSAFSIRRWNIHNAASGTEASAVRSGNAVSVSGIFKGKSIEKEYRIDSRPWYENWGLGMKAILASEERNTYFWTINPTDLNMISLFVSTRERDETIEANGRPVETTLFMVSPAGILSLFYKAEVWVRKSDGRMVRMKCPSGLALNAPILVTDLLEER